MALRFTDASNSPPLQFSKTLAKSVAALRPFRAIASQMLVCDLATLVITDPLLTTFELESRVAEALRKGAFDEIDLVADILKPVCVLRKRRMRSRPRMLMGCGILQFPS